MLVSVIIPAYKQAKSIRKDVENIYNVMSNTRYDFEIIVVVDGFLDKTYEEAKKINKEKVNVVGYENNRGKGYAVRYGMARAKGDYVAFIDAGMEIDPNGISMIMEHMIWYKADIIVGSKRHPASRVSFPKLRRLYSWGYHTLVKLLFRVPINDTQVGLKVFKREVLETVLPRLVVKKYAFDIELLAVAKYLGFRKIYEAPVNISFNFDSGSNFTKFMFLDPLIRNMLVDTIAVFYRMYILGYYHPQSKQKWLLDEELCMRVNTGEFL
jgi:glycosyltransferase involved in cell wall biosynthesis